MGNSAFPSSNSTLNHSRRINRQLHGTNDIYMARYDLETQECTNIPDPQCRDVREFLPLPYKNTKRYAKIFRVLTRIARSDAVRFDDLSVGFLF